MLRRIAALVLAAALLTALGGCAFFEREYEYSEPFTGRLEQTGGNAVEVRNYSMLKAAVLDMINKRRPSGELRFSSYSGNVSDDLAAVCFEVKSANPLGVYAVDTISYDTSRIVSYYVADISITYRRSAEEINSVHTIGTMSELAPYLREQVLTERAEHAVIRSYFPQLDESSIREALEELYLDDPAEMVLPVTAQIESYPREGSSRIFDISLSYPLTEGARSAMADTIRGRVEELRALVQEQQPESAAGTALECARALCALQVNGRPGIYGSSVFGALVDGRADSQGLALAYCVLCRSLGLDCLVVEGSVGAMGSEKHDWNILTLDGENYHVDVSRFNASPAESFLAADDSFWGLYLWDTERYPACHGTLRYTDLVPPEEPEETEAFAPNDGEKPVAPEETQAPEETAPPEETEAPQPAEPPEETQPPAPTEAPEETAPPENRAPPEETQAPEPAGESAEEKDDGTTG